MYCKEDGGRANHRFYVSAEVRWHQCRYHGCQTPFTSGPSNERRRMPVNARHIHLYPFGSLGQKNSLDTLL